MKTSKWANRIAGFVMGLVVAGTLALGLPRNQASPEIDIYQRMAAVEKRVTSIEKGIEADHEAEAAERRRQENRDRRR